jgi:hypothetical protein
MTSLTSPVSGQEAWVVVVAPGASEMFSVPFVH